MKGKIFWILICLIPVAVWLLIPGYHRISGTYQIVPEVLDDTGEGSITVKGEMVIRLKPEAEAGKIQRIESLYTQPSRSGGITFLPSPLDLSAVSRPSPSVIKLPWSGHYDRHQPPKYDLRIIIDGKPETIVLKMKAT